MAKHFFYTREVQVVKKDEQGNAIPLKDEKGEVVKGKFETEPAYREDSFNLSKVIRTHMVDDTHVIVLLDDGHEVTEKTPELKNPSKPAHPQNIIEVKSRVWVQSEISIKGEEAVQRLFEALKAEE